MNAWEKYRLDPDQWAYQGWRQHWLLMWQAIGQQYFLECRIETLENQVSYLERQFYWMEHG